MAQALAIVLSDDPQLRAWALEWNLRGLALRFYDDASAALAAAGEGEVWLFVWDARSSTHSLEAILRRIRGLPSTPECLLVSEREVEGVVLPRENVIHGELKQDALGEHVDRLILLQEIRHHSGIVGQSPSIQALISTIAQVAPLEVPVLIRGESGTGKELVARALHANSKRAAAPFVSVNVGAMSESLLESELFGHEKGAFTGATERHPGVFERANHGTLFLDEVGEMSLAMQVKLLRVLETQEFLRVGGRETVHTDIRLITATHRSLEEGIERGRFRGDLYYRLKVVKIDLVPLRERSEDILLLAHHFLKLANETHGLARKGFTREASERLLHYAWPGNVRELRNVVQSSAVLGKENYLTVEDLPSELREPGREVRPLPMAYGDQGPYGGGASDPFLAHTLFALATDLKEVLRRLERLEARLGGAAPQSKDSEHWGTEAPVAEVTPIRVDVSGDLESAEKTVIQASLGQNGGNRRLTAEQLGISERTLYRKLRRYGLG